MKPDDFSANQKEGKKKPHVIEMMEEAIRENSPLFANRGNGPYGEDDPLFRFSFDMEDALIDDADALKEWSPRAYDVLERKDLPEVCAAIEPDSELEPFVERIREYYELAMQAKALDDAEKEKK